MTTNRDTSSEIDVLYQFAMSYQHPNADQLDDYARRFPAHADALTTLAIELALEQTREEEERTSAPERFQPDNETEAMLSRAMSHFQNRLHEVRTNQEGVTAEHRLMSDPSPVRDLFAHRSPGQMQAFREKLDVSPLFLKRLRDREIRGDTIPDAFIHCIADAAEELAADVASFFTGGPRIAAQSRFKSDVTPVVGRQLTFEEAVRKSDLTPEQQARLLAL